MRARKGEVAVKLLTKQLRAQIPPLGSQQDEKDPVAVARFFTPDAMWTWYVIEGSALLGELSVPLAESDPVNEEDVIFFGYVSGLENELGTFSLSELESVRGPFGLKVERDRSFEPTPLSVIRQWHEREG